MNSEFELQTMRKMLRMEGRLLALEFALTGIVSKLPQAERELLLAQFEEIAVNCGPRLTDYPDAARTEIAKIVAEHLAFLTLGAGGRAS